MYLKREVTIPDFDDALYVEFDYSPAEPETPPSYDSGGDCAWPATVEVSKVRFTPDGDDASALLTRSSMEDIVQACLDLAIDEEFEGEI